MRFLFLVLFLSSCAPIESNSIPPCSHAQRAEFFAIVYRIEGGIDSDLLHGMKLDYESDNKCILVGVK